MSYQNELSAKIRNYSIAAFFSVLTFVIIIGVWGTFKAIGNIQESQPLTIDSRCYNETANIFLGANKDVKNVRCLALDKGYVDTEIFIGDLIKNSEDVCKFELKQNTNEPQRFEIYYDGKIQREVCQWTNYGGFSPLSSG